MIWEELTNYRPTCTCAKCSCGGNKELVDYHHMEYVMSFLMGLNDIFSQVRGQILLLDPIPPINRVFALISQEEHQRQVSEITGSSSQNPSMVFSVKSDSNTANVGHIHITKNNQRKERSICTHCGYT